MIKPQQIWLNVLEWAVLCLAVAAFTITEEYHWYITAGIILLFAAYGLRWTRTGKFIFRTGLEMPLLLFLATAGVATWIAVDQATALLQFARMLAAAVIYYAVLQSEEILRPWLVAGIVLITLALALYWPLQHDFSADQGKFPIIAQVGLWIRAHFPAIPGPFVHANIAASTLAPGLIFIIALANWAGKRKFWLTGLSVVVAVYVIIVLLLTSSRGAWLAVAGTAGLTVLVLVQQRWFHASRIRPRFWVTTLLIGLLILAFLYISGLWEGLLGQVPDPSGTFQSRLDIWQQVGLLIGDAPFTGFGLMSFSPVYSTYGILIQVPFHSHAHNTYLEVAFEQGVPALLALLWGMSVVFVWASRAMAQRRGSPWGWAGLAALSTLAVHSFFDVGFYVTRPLPLIGFFVGMTFLLNESILSSRESSGNARQFSHRWLVPTVVVGAAIILIVAGFYSLLGAWYANLGVIQQTRSELSTYDAANFDNPTLDEVRQQIDLSQAITNFERALRWDAENRTALQRLAQLSLSLGDYPFALTLMQDAWDFGNRDEITRLLLGDALAAQGRPESAAVIVSGLPRAAGRLNTQAWYRYYRQADYERAAFAWQAVLLLDPTNTQALNGLQAIPQP